MAEYIALAAAVTGIILATVLGQPTYALWPLCLALLLNVINRRYGLNYDGYCRRAIGQLDEKMASMELTRVQSYEELNQAIATLNNQANTFDSLEAVESLVDAVQQLRSQQKQQVRAIEQIQDRLNTLTQQFKERPELEQIESLTQVIVALQHLIDDLGRSSSVGNG